MEKNGNILASPEIYKAIPIAADFAPSGGLAKHVLDVYGQPVDARNARTGQVLQNKFDEQLTWLYLVTAQRSHHRANANLDSYLHNVETAIDSLVSFIKAEKVAEIAMPYLCSGRGRLNWLFVKDLLMTKLQDVAVTVVVYHLSKSTISDESQSFTQGPTSVAASNLTESEKGEAENHALSLSLSNHAPQSEGAATSEPAPQMTCESPSLNPLPQVESPTTGSEIRDDEIHTLNPINSDQPSQMTGFPTVIVSHAETAVTPRRSDRHSQQRRQQASRSLSAARARWCKSHLQQGCDVCYVTAPNIVAPNGNIALPTSAPPTNSF